MPFEVSASCCSASNSSMLNNFTEASTFGLNFNSECAEMDQKPMPFEISASCSSAGNSFIQLNVNQSFTQTRSQSFNFNVQAEGSRHGNCSSNQNVNDLKVDWDAKTMLNNLSFLEQKIHNIQGIVRSIVSQKSHISCLPNEFSLRQQLVTTDLTSIIVDLISTAGNILPSIKNNLLSSNPPPNQLCSSFDSSANLEADAPLPNHESTTLKKEKGVRDYNELMKIQDDGSEVNEYVHIEEHDMKESEDGAEVDNLLPGSYEVLQLEKEEILAPHTHFCTICGKGFKRDANLRMHMRGHGDEYKTAAALTKPSKGSEPALIKRYSCPFVGCKRNKDHKGFQPLKTLLCVKNHYKRSHCDKSYICSKCHSKKFSVLADLKTHEKHCGRDKWLCSCGTTFSRKDKLFGHVALFHGHSPALLTDEGYGLGSSEQVNDGDVGVGLEGNGYGYSANSLNDDMDTKLYDDDRGYLSTLNFEPYDYGVSDEFMKVAFGPMENSSIMYPSGLPDFCQKKGDTSSSCWKL